MKKQFIADTICGLLVLLFAYTAISKLQDTAQFVYVLNQSPLLKHFAGGFAIGLPIAELIVSLLLIFPCTQPAGLSVSLGMLTGFTLYIIYMVWFTLDLPCNCGGVLKDLTWQEHIFFNLLFIVINIIGILIYKRKKRLAGYPALKSYVTKVLFF